jgi:mannose-6-phosphate isomerase-like protein (cupin superfamily)
MSDPVKVKKPWGEEVHWALTERYSGKVLRINSGHRLSLQLHEQKEESILVVRGHLRLLLANEVGALVIRDLRPGDSAHIPAGRVHRFEAITKTELIEVSTPELTDVIRLDDDYGRIGTRDP